MEGPRQPLSLGHVAQRLDGLGVTWAVFAGAAAVAFGSSRPLTDVDILIPRGEGDRVAGLFPEGRVHRDEEGIQAVLLSGFDILAGLARLDLDAPMAARLVRHEIAGVLVPVIPPEDNILLKAMWGRGPEQGKHDWEDVEAMLAHLPTLDWRYLRWRASTLASAQEMQPVLQRLEALWQQRGSSRVTEPDQGRQEAWTA